MSVHNNTNVPSALSTAKDRGKALLNRAKCSAPTAGTALLILESCIMRSFAASDNGGQQLHESIMGIFGGVYGLIAGLASAGAAILIVSALIFIGVSKDEKKGAVAIQWIKRIAICWACIILIGPIISWIQGMIGEETGSSLFGTGGGAGSAAAN